MGSTITRSSVGLLVLALGAAGWAGRYISPLPPPPYRSEMSGPFLDAGRDLVKE